MPDELCPCCARELATGDLGGFDDAGAPSSLLIRVSPGRRERCARCGRRCANMGCDAVRVRLGERGRRDAPPIACTAEDLRGVGSPTGAEPCPGGCGHPKHDHDFDGCVAARTVVTSQRPLRWRTERCGCQKWDPLCTAIETGEHLAADVVTPLRPPTGTPARQRAAPDDDA